MPHMIHLHKANATKLFEAGKVAANIEREYPNVKVTGAVGYQGDTPLDCDVFITGDDAEQVRRVADAWIENVTGWTSGYTEVS